MSATIASLFIINKAGGLVYQRYFAKNPTNRTANDYLVLAGTFHGVHAIASKISPEIGSSGIELLEADSFNLHCLQTLTGIKFLAIATPDRPNIDLLLRKIYELYSDFVLKNPFHTPEMPIRCEQFDLQVKKAVGSR